MLIKSAASTWACLLTKSLPVNALNLQSLLGKGYHALEKVVQMELYV